MRILSIPYLAVTLSLSIGSACCVASAELLPPPPPPQTIEDLRAVVAERCGEPSCAGLEAYLECAGSALEQVPVPPALMEGFAHDLSHDRIFCEGFLAAMSGPEMERVRAEAFEAGKLSCSEPPPEPPAGSDLEQVRARLAEACPCADAASHGQYVSCVVQALHTMYDEGAIDHEIKHVLKKEAARSQCGKGDSGGSEEPIDVDEARRVAEDACSCEEARSHGSYVACVSKALREMADVNRIDKATKKILRMEAARSRCGKSSEKKRASRARALR